LILEGVSESDEELPGGLICVNNDDDDNSARADKDDDPGPVVGENDLVPLTLSVDGVNTGGVGTLSILGGEGRINVYESPDRSNPIVLPADYLGSGLPLTLFVEGVQASSAPRDVVLEWEYFLPEGGSCKDRVNISVGGVEFEGTEFTGLVHRNVDLLRVVNPNPHVELDTVPVPPTGAGPAHIKPVAPQGVTIFQSRVSGGILTLAPCAVRLP